MQQEYIEVKRDRFHLLNSNIYILQGIFLSGCTVEAMLDDRLIPADITDWEPTNAWERYREQNTPGVKRVTVSLMMPENLSEYRTLNVFAVQGNRKRKWYTTRVSELCGRKEKPYYYIEELTSCPQAHNCNIRGWVIYQTPVKIEVCDKEGNELKCKIQRFERADVASMYEEAEIKEKCGFFIEIENLKSKKLQIVFKAQNSRVVYELNLNKLVLFGKKLGQLQKKGIRYLKTYGFGRMIRKIFNKFFSINSKPVVYEQWLKRHLPSQKELEQQRNTTFKMTPKFSIIVPLYRTPENYLRAMVRSVQRQTYENWELCLSDGSGANSPLENILKDLEREDTRIKIVHNKLPLKISDNTNAAIGIAEGDFLVFMDHDDELAANALFECVKAICENTGLDILYSDEDKMSMDGNKFFQPHMKSDFNIDLLCTVNYICHLFVVKHNLLQKVGILRPEFDGAQDYDFILRCVEKTKNIFHIPKVLYHWRSHEESTAENPESKLYAFEAGQRAVQAHYDRLGIPATVIKGEYLGLYRTKYLWEEAPLISIMIPNKDHIDDLERCINSIEERSSYHNYEYIIIENNSEKEETFQFYEKLQEKSPKFHVVYWAGEFNYSSINNFGAQHANGEYLLLLNNDTEIINEDCLEELLGYCMRSDVGAVGARLYYEDNTIQHAGVVIGFGGIAGHCFVQQPRGYTGYCHRIICAQDYSAVTAACMMVKRKAFEEVGGLSSDLAVAFNDIDFCLKLGRAGYLIVYNPYAELYHYESKSRGLEDTSEKKARFNKEITTFEKHWPEILRKGDPYYSPNLTLESQDFSLKRI